MPSSRGWWTNAAVTAHVLITAAAVLTAREGRGGTAFVTVMLITFGCFLWWQAGTAWGVTELAWRRRGVKVAGRVVDYDDGSDGSGNFPVIEYTTVAGEVCRHRADVGRWNRSGSGDVEVTYDPERPHRVRERLSPWHVFVGCAILASGCLMFWMAVDGLRLAFPWFRF